MIAILAKRFVKLAIEAWISDTKSVDCWRTKYGLALSPYFHPKVRPCLCNGPLTTSLSYAYKFCIGIHGFGHKNFRFVHIFSKNRIKVGSGVGPLLQTCGSTPAQSTAIQQAICGDFLTRSDVMAIPTHDLTISNSPFRHFPFRHIHNGVSASVAFNF